MRARTQRELFRSEMRHRRRSVARAAYRPHCPQPQVYSVHPPPPPPPPAPILSVPSPRIPASRPRAPRRQFAHPFAPPLLSRARAFVVWCLSLCLRVRARAGECAHASVRAHAVPPTPSRPTPAPARTLTGSCGSDVRICCDGHRAGEGGWWWPLPGVGVESRAGVLSMRATIPQERKGPHGDARAEGGGRRGAATLLAPLTRQRQRQSADGPSGGPGVGGGPQPPGRPPSPSP